MSIKNITLICAYLLAASAISALFGHFLPGFIAMSAILLINVE